jgi:hypothetical protein
LLRTDSKPFVDNRAADSSSGHMTIVNRDDAFVGIANFMQDNFAVLAEWFSPLIRPEESCSQELGAVTVP